MATITISLTGSAIVAGTKSYAISDSDLQKLLDCMKLRYAEALPANPTNQQILLVWVGGWINDTRSQVTQYVKNTAAQQAIETTPGVVIT